MYLYSWLGPVLVTALIAAVLALLLLGSPGVIIMPWRNTTYGSGNGSIGSFGSGKHLHYCC